MLDFKAFHSAAATLVEIEKAHMIRKDQIGQTGAYNLRAVCYAHSMIAFKEDCSSAVQKFCDRTQLKLPTLALAA